MGCISYWVQMAGHERSAQGNLLTAAF